jgi:hypothetical protein
LTKKNSSTSRTQKSWFAFSVFEEGAVDDDTILEDNLLEKRPGAGADAAAESVDKKKLKRDSERSATVDEKRGG